MCYHALSLAEHGMDVELVGYVDSKPHEKIAGNARIRTFPVRPPPDALASKKVPRPLSLLAKFIWSFFALVYTLLFHTAGSSTLLMMQNPPGIPAMLACYVMARLKGAQVVTDWHNYTFSMFATCGTEDQRKNTTGSVRGFKKWLIAFAHGWEGFWGRRADLSVCVSAAMREDLKRRWGVNAVVLYDKAPEHYRSLAETFTMDDRNELYAEYFPYADFEELKRSDVDEVTYHTLPDRPSRCLFTVVSPPRGFQLADDRPFLLVSSTSWTEDEDFGILLEALEEYEDAATKSDSSVDAERLPNLFVVITGKGPLKEFYMARARCLNARSRWVHVATAWLAAEDYPRLLAAADLGVCLHTSTSGVDLPMKVVDMFGCGLPVVAKRFPAIDELVKDAGGTASEQDTCNVRLFDTPAQLCRALLDFAKEFPHNQALRRIRANLTGGQTRAEQWDTTLWPLLRAT
ncbi:glycosyltransferase [Aphelenchoides avenae]|nr:glycosyltransferase [Aphelenchus avenae]